MPEESVGVELNNGKVPCIFNKYTRNLFAPFLNTTAGQDTKEHNNNNTQREHNVCKCPKNNAPLEYSSTIHRGSKKPLKRRGGRLKNRLVTKNLCLVKPQKRWRHVHRSSSSSCGGGGGAPDRGGRRQIQEREKDALHLLVVSQSRIEVCFQNNNERLGSQLNEPIELFNQ